MSKITRTPRIASIGAPASMGSFQVLKKGLNFDIILIVTGNFVWKIQTEAHKGTHHSITRKF